MDAALNNYVALHFASRHMSWLHCMWGVGTVIGPNIMSYALTGGQTWNDGYRYVSYIQMALTIILIISLPLWTKKTVVNAEDKSEQTEEQATAISPLKAIRIKGAKEIMLTFFCYCGLEQTSMLWAGSYMVLHSGVSAEKAASYASVLFIGITVGRLLNGFLTFKFNDTQMIRIGQAIVIAGAITLLLPFGQVTSLIGFILIGLGCAPIYPCIIHSTPDHFGADKSQAMIGIQMASAYVGTCIMPPIFGFLASHIHVAFLPIFLLIILIIMVVAHERAIIKTESHK